VWRNFIHFKSLIDKTAGLSVCLEIGEDLPDNVNFYPIFFMKDFFQKKIINRWMAEDIKAAVIRTKLFTSDNKDLPVLSG